MELERRRGLANARRERESERKALLGKLMRTERHAAQLRDWLARHEQRVTLVAAPDPDLSRMIGWARDRLRAPRTPKTTFVFGRLGVPGRRRSWDRRVLARPKRFELLIFAFGGQSAGRIV